MLSSLMVFAHDAWLNKKHTKYVTGDKLLDVYVSTSCAQLKLLCDSE